MKKFKAVLRSSWNEEIHEIICSSNHPTAGNDKYHDIEELAELCGMVKKLPKCA